MSYRPPFRDKRQWHQENDRVVGWGYPKPEMTEKAWLLEAAYVEDGGQLKQVWRIVAHLVPVEGQNHAYAVVRSSTADMPYSSTAEPGVPWITEEEFVQQSLARIHL